MWWFILFSPDWVNLFYHFNFSRLSQKQVEQDSLPLTLRDNTYHSPQVMVHPPYCGQLALTSPSLPTRLDLAGEGDHLLPLPGKE